MARVGRAQRNPAYFWRGATTFLYVLGEGDLQGVATTTAEGQLTHGAQGTLQAVGTLEAEGSRVHGGELATTYAVATLQAEGEVTLGSQIHEGEATLQGVASLQPEPDVTPEAILIAVAHLSAEAAGEIKLGEALLQGVAHMGFEPEHTSPSPPWGRWSTDIVSRRILPGKHRRDSRRTGVYR